ncbi:MAG: DISARM system helicase DrmA [Symbiobacteriia bacterium]
MLTSGVQVREELVDRLRKELVGPNDDQEVLEENPGDRYLCGILWPTGVAVDAAEVETGDQDASEEDDSAGAEQSVPLAMSMKPSSIGLSFLLEPDCKAIHVRATWGTYQEEIEGNASRWVRTPVSDEAKITLKPGAGRQQQPSEKDPDVFYTSLARVRKDGRVAVSLFLINRKDRPERGREDAYCLFQPSLVVTGEAPDSAPFEVRELRPPESANRTDDLIQDDLLYRHEKAFAVGHGTSVQWEADPQRSDRAVKLETVTIPEYEVPRMIPLPWRGAGSLDMQVLADLPNGEAVYESLAPLLDAYDQWIQARTQELAGLALDDRLRNRAEEHRKQWERSLNRMRTGLDLIVDDPQVCEAFRFANRAMVWQRTQASWAQACNKSKDWSKPPAPVKSEWRPFQIAFILQALAGVVEPTHPDRELADLLWFPTGGGKTEAYLGLSAVVMGLRRLRGEQEGVRGDVGVNVIMRYTLRLLTIQQFQRASTLICAMELLRKKQPETWGQGPFRIGLWIGPSTPNNFDDAEKALRPEDSGEGSTPVQLVTCPWCGSPLERKHYRAQQKTRRVLIGCSRRECDFALKKPGDEGIPALVEDEEIYRLAPSLVIGTVDKFAQISWLPETQSLFGHIKGEVPGWGYVVEGEGEQTSERRQKVVGSAAIADKRPLLPPDLVIQDELHLISGPLGTMVGAYETAIDELCSRSVDGQRVGPKIVASTATIRRAEEQVKGLFERKVAVFPAPGLSATDSFFAVEQPLEQTPGRLYLGIFAPPRSVKTALVRVYSVLLSSIEAIDAEPRLLDPYYTVVGYFNSLRELGGAVRLVEDDIPARIGTIIRSGWNPLYQFTHRQLQQDVPELTSRVESRDIPKRLDELARTYNGKRNSSHPPVDVVLASNMISVGVDVSRLGLMVVTGQPKTTSEYIQATSRVGREHPGLVITVYNWARPRDLSHYERFRSYHAALYRYVEAISVTPFSSRARDRALYGLFIAMCRQRVPGLAGSRDASKFKVDSTAIKRLRSRVLDRAKYIDTAVTTAVGAQLDGMMASWEKDANTGALHYSKAGKTGLNLMRPLGDRKELGRFPAPNSMRDVETPVGLYLRNEEEN